LHIRQGKEGQASDLLMSLTPTYHAPTRGAVDRRVKKFAEKTRKVRKTGGFTRLKAVFVGLNRAFSRLVGKLRAESR
jgi:hypothetical protein